MKGIGQLLGVCAVMFLGYFLITAAMDHNKQIAVGTTAPAQPAAVANTRGGVITIVVTATPPLQAASPLASGESAGTSNACQFMTRISDLSGGVTTLPAGWVIANVYKEGQSERKVLISPTDTHTISGWKGSAWTLPAGCDASAQQNFSSNPLPPMSVNGL